MKIAILSFGNTFGSQINGIGKLKCGGPELPLEFSRIRLTGRLSLVIDRLNGQNNDVFYYPVEANGIENIVNQIKATETIDLEDIGWIDFRAGDCSDRATRREDIVKIIDEWCKDNGFDGAVWDDRGARFFKVTNERFSVETAAKYLKNRGLTEQVYRDIQKYPISIKTKLRSFLCGDEEFEIVDEI